MALAAARQPLVRGRSTKVIQHSIYVFVNGAGRCSGTGDTPGSHRGAGMD